MRYIVTKSLETLLRELEDRAIIAIEHKFPSITTGDAELLCPPIASWTEGDEYASDIDGLDEKDVRGLDRLVELGFLTKEGTPLPRCPKCGELIDVLLGTYPASIPGKACLVGGKLYIDTLDGIKLCDTIDEDVSTWHCPHCDAELFIAGEEDKMTEFLKGGTNAL